MNDYMTQEEAERMNSAQAIQILEPMQKMMLDQYGCPISEAYFAIGKAIEALKARQWIPCSERLPKPPCFCIVTTDGSHNDVIDIALYMSDGWHKASKVLAWMPLPKSYKGENNEQDDDR